MSMDKEINDSIKQNIEVGLTFKQALIMEKVAIMKNGYMSSKKKERCLKILKRIETDGNLFSRSLAE